MLEKLLINIIELLAIVILFFLFIEIKKYINRIIDERIINFNKSIDKELEEFKKKYGEYKLSEDFIQQLTEKLDYEYNKPKNKGIFLFSKKG